MLSIGRGEKLRGSLESSRHRPRDDKGQSPSCVPTADHLVPPGRQADGGVQKPTWLEAGRPAVAKQLCQVTPGEVGGDLQPHAALLDFLVVRLSAPGFTQAVGHKIHAPF